MASEVKDRASEVRERGSEVNEREAAVAAPANRVIGDRRRPGRIENVSPALIPLLRQPAGVSDPDASKDDLRLPKGIAVGVLLAIPLWALIIGGISLLLR